MEDIDVGISVGIFHVHKLAAVSPKSHSEQQASYKGGDGYHVVTSASCLPPVVPSDCRRLQHHSPLLGLSSTTACAALRSHSHRVDSCITSIRLSLWSWSLRRYDDVTLSICEEAGKDPGAFLTPAERR